MKEPDSSTIFAGLDGRSDAQLPEWYKRNTNTNGGESVSFAEAIRALPQAIDTTVAYKNPYTSEWVETERFSAIVEPSRLRMQEQANGENGDGADGGDHEQIDPLFHIPSDSYTILNPQTVYGPLEEMLRDRDLDGTPFAEIVFGEIRQYRAGGEIHMDIMFDGLDVTLPDTQNGDREPITMGLTSGYDFFGGHAVYVEGFAQDGACSNSMRALTDKQIIKHVGDVRDFGEWWEGILAQLDLVANDLIGFIDDAREIDLEFTELPFSVEEFYTLLEFPTYLAERAAEDARANAADPFVIDLWALHSGATYALTHFFRGREGSSLDGYVRVANDILFNPEGTIERVERAYEATAAGGDGDEGEQAALGGECGLARIEQMNENLQANVQQFEDREEALRARFRTVAE
jgi:hypothetical protein